MGLEQVIELFGSSNQNVLVNAAPAMACLQLMDEQLVKYTTVLLPMIAGKGFTT
jgi:hypothetical protein